RAQMDPLHSLTPVQHFIDFFRTLRPLQDHTMVSLIGGPPEPFATETDPQTRFTELAHSCFMPAPGGLPDASPPDTLPLPDAGTPPPPPPPGPPPPMDVFADPAVRLSQFVQSFGDRGRFVTLCQASYADALQGFASNVRDAVQRQCVGQDLAMASNPST